MHINHHREVCIGDKICKICGRKGCGGCIHTRSRALQAQRPEIEGMCIICSGLYKEEEILLFPPSLWDTKTNKIIG